jgi:serine/threonine protein kinase
MQIAYNNLSLLTTSNLEQVLGTLLDPMSFPELHHFAEGLKKAYRCVEKERVTNSSNLGSLLGAIGLVCFTLDLLNIAECQCQTASLPDLSWSQMLLTNPEVQRWFKQVYVPPQSLSNHQNTSTKKQEEAKLKVARKHWQDLDFDSLELYRVGTTSFILRCQTPLLADEKLVLKCLLFPYTRIPAITDTTRNYSLPSQSNALPATARVFASTSKWILMDFIDGLNLREFLQKRRRIENQQPPLLRIDLLASIGKPLLTALTHLSHTNLYHEDLTPSNIMVHEKFDGSIDKITLIDIGRNYLYTRHVGIEASREALFVAPEVKAGQNTEETSDLYSFGMILIELADPIGVQGGPIPESLYLYAPHLARFIEDLIDTKPENRRLVFPIKDRKDPYANLCCLFEDLLKVLPSEREMKAGRFFWVQQFLALFYPARQRKHAWDLWRMTRTSSMHPEIAKYTGWLFGWLFVSMFTSWTIFGLSLVWGSRDLGMNPFLPPYISIPQTLVRGCGGICLPLQNLFYSYGVQNLPMRGVGLSIGLVQSAYYPNILAGLTTWSMRGKLARATGWCLRLQTFIAFPVIAIGNLVQPGWWLALLIIGLLVPTLVNIFCYKLATRTLKIARTTPTEISTAPPGNDPSLKSFGSWGAMLFAYIVVLCGIWTGLHFGKLSDVWSYTGIIVVVNVLVLCISKSIIQAPTVRGGLSRAFTLGERLEALDQKSRKNISKP